LKPEEDVCAPNRMHESAAFFTLSHTLTVTHTTSLSKASLFNLTHTMPFDKPLFNLIEQPFGPYLEERVLSNRCRFMASKRLLLRDFQLAHNDEPMG
jgi:hypothetical protein